MTDTSHAFNSDDAFAETSDQERNTVEAELDLARVDDVLAAAKETFSLLGTDLESILTHIDNQNHHDADQHPAPSMALNDLTQRLGAVEGQRSPLRSERDRLAAVIEKHSVFLERTRQRTTKLFRGLGDQADQLLDRLTDVEAQIPRVLKKIDKASVEKKAEIACQELMNLAAKIPIS